MLYVDPVPFGSASRRRSVDSESPTDNPPRPRPGSVASEVADETTDRIAELVFEDVFDAHYERLVRALTVYAGDRDTAADAVQDAFVKAHLRWRKVSRYDDPVGWVRRVAINRLRNAHRGETRRRRALERMASRRQDGPTEPEIDEFGRLLATLPRQQRLATSLFYVAGLPVAEIATTLDLSEGTVKSHLHDARQRLRPLIVSEREHD